MNASRERDTHVCEDTDLEHSNLAMGPSVLIYINHINHIKPGHWGYSSATLYISLIVERPCRAPTYLMSPFSIP